MTRTRRGALVALALFARAASAHAQQPTDGRAAAPLVAPDSIAPYVRVDGGRVRPATYVYQLALVRNGVQTPLGVRTVQVSEANAGGMPGWLIAESRTGSAVPTSDSLWPKSLYGVPQSS